MGISQFYLSRPEEDMDDELFTESPVSSQNFQTDQKSTVQHSSTSRSKHSVTEQRRRSKINERFQILRDIIPQNDQKKDKASFLLEVIEYIQLLQNKLRLYEGSFESWNQEPSKLVPWRNSHGTVVDGFGNHSNSGQEMNEVMMNAQNTLDSESNVCRPEFLHGPTEMPIPPAMFSRCGDHSPMQSLLQGSFSQGDDIKSTETLNQGSRGCEFVTENRAGSVSSAHSQGLLNTLTEALQASGVDTSQVNISVQLDLVRKMSAGTATGLKGSGSPDCPRGSGGLVAEMDDLLLQPYKKIRRGD